MSKPAVGMSVLFHPSPKDPAFLNVQAAIVSLVHPGGEVNLLVINPNGEPYSKTLVPVGETGPPNLSGWVELPDRKKSSAKVKKK